MPIVENIDFKRWQEFLDSNNCQSIYFTPEMYAFYKNYSKTKPIPVAYEEDGNILGIALGEVSSEGFRFFGLTQRTVFYSEPLYNGDLKILDLLLKEIKNQSKGLFIQIRVLQKMSEKEKKIYMDNGFEFVDHLSATIGISDKESLWNNLAGDKKKGIKKAINKYQIEISHETNQKEVDIFYDMLSSLYRKKRHPLKSRDYFHNLVKHLRKYVKIYFAYYKKQPIATQMVITYKDRMLAFYTSTLPEHRDKHAGDLLIWKLLETAIERKIHLFDFGGAGNPNRSYGPRDYKLRFGSTFENTGRFILKRSILYHLMSRIYFLLLKRS